VFETARSHSGGTELASKMDGQNFEDTNLEVIGQLEELAARFHAYEAICTHLYRERIPLQPQLENHSDL
jgi:hypothetical protein